MLATAGNRARSSRCHLPPWGWVPSIQQDWDGVSAPRNLVYQSIAAVAQRLGTSSATALPCRYILSLTLLKPSRERYVQ